MKMFFKYVILLMTFFTLTATAITFDDSFESRCTLSKEELSSPDAAIKSGMDNALSFFNAKCLGWKVEDRSFYQADPQIYHPQKLIASLEKKYGHLREPMTEVSSQVFREYKILDKKNGQLIDGHESIEYKIEVLYVLFKNYWNFPKANKYGFISVCERDIVFVHVINTPKGWLMRSRESIGVNFQSMIEGYRNSDPGSMYRRDPKKGEIKIKSMLEIASKCKNKI